MLIYTMSNVTYKKRGFKMTISTGNEGVSDAKTQKTVTSISDGTFLKRGTY